jgi:tetratricopeptide (TPR) repeat protein
MLLTTAALLSYSSVTHNGFLNYDDDQYVTSNVHVRSGLTPDTVKWAFTTFFYANWHPLTWLSHALDCQLFALNPAGHHNTSVLLHTVNAVLLFLLLQSATGFRWRSLMVAALFALHPINVESVAWVAERKNVLSMFFFLLALYAYTWYARRPGIERYTTVFFAFAVSLLAKPQAITFPFLLLLWDYWPLGRISVWDKTAPPSEDACPRKKSTAWLLLEKLPLLLLSAASSVITMKAQSAGGALQTTAQYSLLLRCETAVVSYPAYLSKALWPTKLVALYPHPTALYPVWQVMASAVTLLVITIFAVRARDQRYLAVGWFWFLGSFVPMIGLVQVGAQGMADRYAYLPLIGLFLMFTWLVADAAQALRVSAHKLAIPAVACLLVLATVTHHQVSYWRDTPSFWLRTLALTDNNYVAHDAMGQFLASQGQMEEAAAHFRAALAIRSDDLPANLNLGAYEHSRGHLPAAIERYQMVALHAADTGLRATAFGNLGSAYRQMGDFAQAKQCYQTALQLAPDQAMAMARIGLGLIAQKEGDLPEAVRQYSSAMSLQPTDVGYLLLAQALKAQGRSDEAQVLFDRVARLSPNLDEARKAAEALLSGK